MLIPNFTRMDVLLEHFHACEKAKQWVGKRDLRTALQEVAYVNRNWIAWLATEFWFADWLSREQAVALRQAYWGEFSDQKELTLSYIAEDHDVKLIQDGATDRLVVWYQAQGCQTVRWDDHITPLVVFNGDVKIASYHRDTFLGGRLFIDPPPAPKVLIAYYHDTVGATPNNWLINQDGDLLALVEAVTEAWLVGTGLTDEQIGQVRRDLLSGLGADIPTPPDAIASLAQIVIDEHNADDPDIQALLSED